MRNSRPFPNNPLLKIRHRYVCTSLSCREVVQGVALAPLELAGLAGKLWWRREGLQDMFFPRVSLWGRRKQTHTCHSPQHCWSRLSCLLLFVPMSKASWLQPDLACFCTSRHCSCVLPVTLLAGKCSLFTAL